MSTLISAHARILSGANYLGRLTSISSANIGQWKAGTFGYPQIIGGGPKLSIVPWSRIFNKQEIVLAINTDADNARTAWVTIDYKLHQEESSVLTCIYSTESTQIGTTCEIEARNGRAIQLTVPGGGFVIYE
ncbi:MAG: hypothetical protein Q7U98_18925 [Methylicorpusculum sp.]|uniref:hypothetical protein n=1 Tax=Methylicorpusculum sp. TaxID=2713644 RepID=UPI0027216036|nr:hypothetical protein [Methylicorpusculum sp.]MDO8846306.1 hypothetical protein [Methylicorpusculum sp.]MDO8941233.1 hypothetical protein [Methylicorpusculum sp.]MDP2203709.1 hypothetical protein [Methylicorpusculum sp.]